MSKLTRQLLVAAGVLDADAARFIESGLPEGEIGHLMVRPEFGQQPVLAYDGGVPLVVEEGRVLALDGTRRFVNSSVIAFLDVVARYKRYVEEVAAAGSDAEGEHIARQAAEEMRSLDPPAFGSQAGYWPIVCTQIR